jgi:hypothetical protein
MLFGSGKKVNVDNSSIQQLDDDDLEEIKKVREMLNPNEEVLVANLALNQADQLLHQTLSLRPINGLSSKIRI